MTILLSQLKQTQFMIIKETLVWAMGNLATDNPDYKSQLLNMNGMQIILDTLTESSQQSNQSAQHKHMFKNLLNEVMWVMTVLLGL